MKGGMGKSFGKGKGFPKGKGFKGKGKGGKQLFRDWSVELNPDWPVKSEIPLPALYKLSLGKDMTDPKAKKDLQIHPTQLQMCGSLPTYDKAFDRISPKLDKPLTRGQGNIYNVTARDDVTLQEYMQEGVADVIVSDAVLAAIMSAPRSQYSWDIVVCKLEDKLIFDKRDGAALDFLTVNETSPDPPQNDDKDSINAPQKLGTEATTINHNFMQQVGSSTVPKKQLGPHPFADDDEENAIGAYKYQQFTLPALDEGEEYETRPYNVVVRSEYDCQVAPATAGEEPVLATVQALNEYTTAKNLSGQGWRQSLENQRGAVLATELKNNSFKLGRWTCQALVGGAGLMKFGYVSRATPADANRHRILSVQTYKTLDFATQMGLSLSNAWAVFRHVVHLCMATPGTGKFLLCKDPTKPMMRLYDIPWETFEEEEEEEEGEEGEWDGDDEPVGEGKGPIE
jgi:translation initiation factor 3 subunit D